MNFSFTPGQELIRSHVIAFAQKELNAGIIERDRLQQFPKELWLKCGEQKYQGLAIPEDAGGAGLDPFSTAIAFEALGYASEDKGLNFSIAAHFSASVIPLWKHGTAAQKEMYLESMCGGKKIAVNAMTESESGSDVFKIKTKAEKTANGYVLNGVKTFCTNGTVADIVIVYAVTDEPKGFHGGISAFILDKNTPGIRVGQEFEKMGLRSSPLCELIFENVIAKEENVLGGIGGGTSIFNHSMEWERIMMSALHAGTMENILEKCIHYAQSRHAGNEPIGKKQAVAHRIATMRMQLEASKMLLYKAAEGLENNRENALNASIAKVYVSEAFTECAKEAIGIFGGNGYMTEYGIERILRDAVGSTIYSGTSDIHRNIISRWLGL